MMVKNEALYEALKRRYNGDYVPPQIDETFVEDLDGDEYTIWLAVNVGGSSVELRRGKFKFYENLRVSPNGLSLLDIQNALHAKGF